MKIIGCGGRQYMLQGNALFWVEHALQILEVNEIIDGGAPGADSAFHQLALKHGIDSVRMFANWEKFQYAAGPIRNRKQLRYLLWSASHLNETCAVFALPGGKGTQNMIVQAVAGGIRVIAPTDACLQSPPPTTIEEIYDAHLC